MERWDLYDKNRNKLNKMHIRDVLLPKGCYHLVVHVWVQNDNGEILYPNATRINTMAICGSVKVVLY